MKLYAQITGGYCTSKYIQHLLCNKHFEVNFTSEHSPHPLKMNCFSSNAYQIEELFFMYQKPKQFKRIMEHIITILCKPHTIKIYSSLQHAHGLCCAVFSYSQALMNLTHTLQDVFTGTGAISACKGILNIPCESSLNCAVFSYS